ncbi:MAG TPA: DUF485 domain-containing protein [Bacteroidota bacterium]|jgi:uncharacterized membrane protein (DUF485 family)|nr:DUF485 domain-containing protein [Bacteroidota bacterium]
MSISQEDIKGILESETFRALVRKRVSVTLTLTIVMLVVYFGFILTIAFNKELLAAKIGEHMTIGLPIGIGIIVFAWLLTGVYTRWANSSYDRSVRELRKKITSH